MPVPSTDLPETVRGPWMAVVLDGAGYVLDLTEDDIEDACRIAIVRGSAMPTGSDYDEIPRVPSQHRFDDVLYEARDLDDEPERVPIIWEQAQAIAEAMNAGPVIAAAIAWRRDASPIFGDLIDKALCAAVDEMERLNARPSPGDAT